MALSLGLNSNNAYMDHGDVTAIDGATALSMSFWQYRGGAGTNVPIQKGALDLFVPWVNECMIRQTGVWSLESIGNTIPANVWVHLMLVYDGSLAATNRVTIYMDGVSLPLSGSDNAPQGTSSISTAPTSLPVTSPATLQVGNSNSSALMGCWRIWTAALTTPEWQQEQLRLWALRRTNLVLDCLYDDALAGRDYSSNGFHGTWIAPGTPAQTHGPPVYYGGKVLVVG